MDDRSPSERPRAGPTSRALLVVLALAAFAFALMRLRRVARPTFIATQTFFGGTIALGEVTLARRGSVGRRLGSTLVCRDREVIARAGPATLSVLAVDATGRTVDIEVSRSGEATRRARVHADDCRVQWLTAPALHNDRGVHSGRAVAVSDGSSGDAVDRPSV